MSQILTSKSARIQQSQELRLKLTAFTDILSVVGVKLSFDDDPHSLTQEQALVLRDLDKCFSDSPERVYEFVRGLKAVCKKEKYFKKALLPTWLKRNTDSDDSFLTSVKIQQDSLFRILLKSNHIQKDVINILLDEIAAVASKEEEDTSWLRLLLNCCGVIMPDVEDASDLDPEQVTLVADCLFHCINWFRELINGYVTQKNKKMRVKAAQRLQDIIDLEKRLYECMERAPDHKLPVSYFDSTTEMQKQMTSPLKADKKGSKKKFKSAAVVSQGNDTVASTSAAPVPVKKKKPVVKTQEFQVHFREMDSDLVVLLRYPLRFDEQDPSQFTSYTCSLNIDQVKFILGDYVAKLRALTEGKNIGLSHLNVVAPISIISDSVIILPNIDMHLKVILKKINKLLEITDGRHDLPDMYTEEAIKTKTCFGYILDIFYLTFNWAGFQFSTNRELLKNILKSIRPIQTQTANTANRLVVELLNRFACFHEQCLQLSHAVSLIKTMEALCVLTGSSPEVEKKITTVTEKLLGNRWYNSKGKECNTNISILVKVYLKHTDVKTLGKLVGTLEEQASTLNTKEDCLHMLASIDKQNLHIFYAGICNALLNRVKVEIQSLTNHQHLVLWRTVAMTMQSLMVVSKLRETNTILATFLKKSIGILNVFLSQGIPILEIMLRSKPDEVVEIFKMMQNNTRYLHTLCCYSKLKKEKSLMALVPKFRMTLETFVYRAKAALVANNCSTAFWIGNLRNKDLHGDEILSQDSSVVQHDFRAELYAFCRLDFVTFSSPDTFMYRNFSSASLAFDISSLINTSLSEYRDLATISSSILVSAWNSCLVLSPETVPFVLKEATT
ncbi:hypothetical protein NQ315_017309 [Exocentrus adspersus]|uniref:Fanconi anemia group D2 protein n=1 Tax=Exocentrus adspersus TaxID=1586481 RepID=A0AAV8VK98_9CUCU|nr:hypothetical protein NQ315_017309 [Exocentrus adspersus]